MLPLSDIGIGLVGMLIILFISALPLYFAVKYMGGEASILKVLLANLIVGVIYFFVPSLIAFVLLLFVYKAMFELSWSGALGAWILQIIIAIILGFVFVILGAAALLG